MTDPDQYPGEETIEDEVILDGDTMSMVPAGLLGSSEIERLSETAAARKAAELDALAAEDGEATLDMSPEDISAMMAASADELALDQETSTSTTPTPSTSASTP